jgi:hypothetical protein
MAFEFTEHNIHLDNGTFTKPEMGFSMETHPWFVSARRILNTVFPGDKNHLRLADLGCLEGGYAVEFARMGFQVVGIEIREANIRLCQYVKANTNLPSLEFIKDDAWNIKKYGLFDVVFCCGLLYHLDKPKQFLHTLSGVTKKLLILQTHFSTETSQLSHRLPRIFRKLLARAKKQKADPVNKYGLSLLTDNEMLQGRWYTEFAGRKSFDSRDSARCSSWENRRSFWVQKEYLLQAIQDAGFDLVLEQFDSLGPNITESMLQGYYKSSNRGTFIGIKT